MSPRPGEREYLGKRLITGPEDHWTDAQRIAWIMTGDPQGVVDEPAAPRPVTPPEAPGS